MNNPRGAGQLAIGRNREALRSPVPSPAPSPKENPVPKASPPINVGERPMSRSDTEVPPPASSGSGKQLMSADPTFTVPASKEGSQIKRPNSVTVVNGAARPPSSTTGIPLVSPLTPLASLPQPTSVAASPPVAGPRRPTSAKALDLAKEANAIAQSPPGSPAPVGAGVKRDKSPRPSVFAVFSEGSQPPVSSTPPPPASPLVAPVVPAATPPPTAASALTGAYVAMPAPVAALNAYALPPPFSSVTYAQQSAAVIAVSAAVQQSTRAPTPKSLSPDSTAATGAAPQPRLRRSPSEDDLRQSRTLPPTDRPSGLRRSPSSESFFSGIGTMRLRSAAVSVIEKEKERIDPDLGMAKGKLEKGTEPPREVDIRRSIAKTRAERTLRKMSRPPPPIEEVFGNAFAKQFHAQAAAPLPRSTSSTAAAAVTPSASSSRPTSPLPVATAASGSPTPNRFAPTRMMSTDAVISSSKRSGTPSAAERAAAVATPPKPREARERRGTLFPVLPTPKLQELLSEEGGEELVKAVRRYADRTDLAARNEQGLTPLHEACEAHAVYAVLEFIRLKAPVTIRAAGGNTPLHLLFRSTKWQEFKDHKSLTFMYNSIISAAAKYVPMKTDILEAENDRGETLLFRAASAGNFTAVLVLLQHGAHPFAAFYPEDAVPTHDDSVRALQVAITDSKEKLLLSGAAEARKAGKKSKPTSLLRPPPVNGAKRPDLRSGPPSSWQYMATRMQDEPLALDTLELVNKLFSAAYAHRESWSMMQNVQLTEDQTSLLKEERGRYYVGFAASHEVLQCLRDSFTLWNSSDVPIKYEISKYFPDLSTWGAAMLRLEVIGQRRGILQPGERQRLQVNLFSTTAVEFRQLICFTYTLLDTREPSPPKPRGLYFFLAASLRPPPDLLSLEIDRNLLPVLSDVLGSGASATVFRVHNFIPERTQTTRALAVKRFNYSLEGGLQETSEDYRRFRLELYISSKMMHPNVVRTYGFVAHPPCLVMEYVPMNLRRLIDDKTKPLALHTQMKIAIHIAKGMAYLHSFNIIHRDLKPGNVLVSDNYDAKVADFGVSLSAKRGKNKQLESEMTKVEGTDFYMAPELFNISSSQLLFSLESDIYAFGIVLYELFNRCNLLEALLRRGFNRGVYYQNRARGDYPVEGAITAPHPAIQDLLRACWAAVPTNRVAFQAIVDIVTELRAEVLELSLEEEFDEARKEGLEIRVLKEWNARRAGPNADYAERFTNELRSNRQVAAALVRYFLTANPGPAAEAEISQLFELYLGHKGAADFILNLSSIRPALAERKPGGVEAFLTQVLGTALAAPPAMRDQLYRTGLAEDQVVAWFEFVDQAARDPKLRQDLGPGRYDEELSELDRRMIELREELKRCEKRKAKLEAAPPATVFLSEIAGLDSLPAEFPAALLERLEREVERLAENAQRLLRDQLAAEVRRLESRLGAIERLYPRGQVDPLVEELRSKLQELTILTYV